MAAALVALVAAVSISVWAYTRLQNRAGYGNTAPALKGAAVVFFMTFVVILTVALLTFH